MIGKRLQTANKKAAKRWLRFHEHSFFNGPIGFGIGVYRKTKQGSVRSITRFNQEQKKSRVKSIRRKPINHHE